MMNRPVAKTGLVALFSLLLTAAPGHADVKLPPVFAPHMVLQRDQPITIWGTADAGEKVQVALGPSRAAATADAQGRWRVALPPLHPADDPRPLALTVAGRNRIEIPDVKLGDVWVLAGGSLAGSAIRGAADAAALAKLPDADARILDLRSANPAWAPLTARNALAPAIACVFANTLAHESRTPVGIIAVVSRPQTRPIEAWIRSASLKSVPAAAPIFDYYSGKPPVQLPRESRADYQRRLAQWKQQMQALPLEPTEAPAQRGASDRRGLAPGEAFDALLQPLVPFAIRGVIWAHGEDDASVSHAQQYAALLPALIGDWRAAWGRADLPFIILQSPAASHPRYDDRAGAELRRAQSDGADAAPHTALVVTVDLGVNPPVLPIGQRVAGAALRLTDSAHAPAPGPRFDSAQTDGNRMVIRLKNAAGLRAAGGAPRGFAIATPKGRWVWADAAIQPDGSVTLTAPGVDRPVAASYAWHDLPQRGANVYNAAGLPLAPFFTKPGYEVTAGVNRPQQERRSSALNDRLIEDPRLPRLLLIGDSIAGGELPPLRTLLAGKANVILRNNSGTGQFYTTSGALHDDTLKKFLEANDPFDVIHFNMGIHEFAASKNPKADAAGYAHRLREVVKVLKGSGAKVIWCSSSGTVRDGLVPRFPYYLSACQAFNAAAAQVMAEESVPVNDLYAFTQPHIEEWQNPGDHIHFKPEYKPKIAEFLLPEILRQLPAPRPAR